MYQLKEEELLLQKSADLIVKNIFPHTYVFYHKSCFGIKENSIIPDIEKKIQAKPVPFSRFLSFTEESTVFNPISWGLDSLRFPVHGLHS